MEKYGLEPGCNSGGINRMQAIPCGVDKVIGLIRLLTDFVTRLGEKDNGPLMDELLRVNPGDSEAVVEIKTGEMARNVVGLVLKCARYDSLDVRVQFPNDAQPVVLIVLKLKDIGRIFEIMTGLDIRGLVFMLESTDPNIPGVYFIGVGLRDMHRYLETYGFLKE